MTVKDVWFLYFVVYRLFQGLVFRLQTDRKSGTIEISQITFITKKIQSLQI